MRGKCAAGLLHVAKTKSRKSEIQTGPSISPTARRQGVRKKMKARVQSARTTAVSGSGSSPLRPSDD